MDATPRLPRGAQPEAMHSKKQHHVGQLAINGMPSAGFLLKRCYVKSGLSCNPARPIRLHRASRLFLLPANFGTAWCGVCWGSFVLLSSGLPIHEDLRSRAVRRVIWEL